MLFQLSYIGAEMLRSYKGDGLDGNVCVGRFYEHRFAVLVKHGTIAHMTWYYQVHILRTVHKETLVDCEKVCISTVHLYSCIPGGSDLGSDVRSDLGSDPQSDHMGL